MIPTTVLQEAAQGETSEQIQARVRAARERQLARQGCSNAQLSGQRQDEVCRLSDDDNQWFRAAIERLQLSARGYHRVLKLARTIADLNNSDQIRKPHLLEAIGYRSLDRYGQS